MAAYKEKYVLSLSFVPNTLQHNIRGGVVFIHGNFTKDSQRLFCKRWLSKK